MINKEEMKSFKAYLIESLKVYEYKIKFCFEPSEEHIKLLAVYLQKYDPIELTEPVKTILQKNPLDFPDIENTEVYTITFTTNLPLSSYILQQEIKNWLGIPEKFIRVRSKLEPVNIESDILNANDDLKQEAEKNNFTLLPKLSNKEEYPESEKINNGSEYFSNTQVEKFKSYMKELKKNRISKMYKLSSEIAFELNTEYDDNDFNKNIKDAPKVYHRLSKEEIKNDDNKKVIVNQYDDFPELKREYTDSNGNVKLLSKKIGK